MRHSLNDVLPNLCTVEYMLHARYLDPSVGYFIPLYTSEGSLKPYVCFV